MLPEQDQSEVVDEHEANNDHEFPNQGAHFVEVEDPAELIDQSDYSLDGNQSGEAMVYEGDPENPGVSWLFFLNIVIMYTVKNLSKIVDSVKWKHGVWSMEIFFKILQL